MKYKITKPAWKEIGKQSGWLKQGETGLEEGKPRYNPDFNVKEFKSNFVARWEYKPGSTLFIVWSQGRNGYDPNGEFDLGRDMNDLFDVQPHNIFLIKFSYRFVL